MQRAAAIQPSGAEAVGEGGIGPEGKQIQEVDRAFVGLIGIGQRAGALLPLENIAAIHPGNAEIATDARGRRTRPGREDADRLVVTADGLGQRARRFVGMAAGERGVSGLEAGNLVRRERGHGAPQSPGPGRGRQARLWRAWI